MGELKNMTQMQGAKDQRVKMFIKILRTTKTPDSIKSYNLAVFTNIEPRGKTQTKRPSIGIQKMA